MMEHLGRYSYLSADPFCTWRIDKPQAGALESMAKLLAKYYTPPLPSLPPMQGGVLGWFGYELGECFERLPSARYNEFHLPLAVCGLYDVVLAWDHATNEAWLISQGLPALDTHRRARRAYQRMQDFLKYLEAPDESLAASPSRIHDLPSSHLCPQFPTRWSSAWTSNFSSAGFRQAVAKAIEYVHAGDIFQVNMAQRLMRRATCPARDLYLHLRRENPVPFGGYAAFGRTQIVSSSPERFLQLAGREMETRPIKGTRPRLSDPAADKAMAQLLLHSDKDRAENIMIVDLLRNDLSRVADADSVKVTSLCHLEAYRYVWHLVSIVRARLADPYTACDLLQATFPGGSITGAPKIRAMEIISELEQTARGPYCGSLGFLSLAGDMDLSILIRTLTACDGWWQVPVGGGIVAASDPVFEEQETWHKAEGILRAIDSLSDLSGRDRA